MNVFESLFLNANFSWTWSKIIPYLLTFLLGLFAVFLLKKRLSNFGVVLRLFFKIFTFCFFFLLYFSFYPIYEGDFTNSSTQIERTQENNELSGKKIVVLSIPGCPFCYESIGRMKGLIKRNPFLKVEYLVCSEDESTLDWYKEESGDLINVSLAKNAKEMVELAKGSFPTFVLVNGENELKVWSNNSFGVLAMDEIEEVLGTH